MRLLLTVGYYNLLFGPGAEVGAIIEALEGVKIVDRSYGAPPQKYRIQEGTNVHLELLADDDIQLPENTEKDGLFDQMYGYRQKAEEAEREIATLKKKLEEITAAVTPKEEEEKE